MQTGATYGEWIVGGRLGGGGNGEVWEARSLTRPGAFAIKFLTVADQPDRLARFRDEVAFLIDNPRRPGILPLVDSRLDVVDGEPLWYVMPRAERLADVLATRTPEKVIEAVTTIATTLADLAGDDIGHRDIKPDNLFVLDDKPVIGDFGLVTYPAKDPVTPYGLKLGPSDYMAPEMRRNADTAAHEPADVWSLAKTLWELLVKQHPLPGPHRPDDEAYALQARLLFSSAREVDQLLTRATVIEPEKRTTLSEFAQELNECLRPPAETLPAPSTAEVEKRIFSMTAYSHERDEALMDKLRQGNDAFRSLQDVLSDAYHALAQRLPHFHSSYGNNVTDALGALGPGPMPFNSHGWGGTFRVARGETTVIVDLAVGMRQQSIDSPSQMQAIMRVNEGRRSIYHERFDWRLPMTAHVDSAAFRNYLADVRSGFFGHFPAVLITIAQILGSVLTDSNDSAPE